MRDSDPIDINRLRLLGFEFDGESMKFSCIHLKLFSDHWRVNIGGWWEYMPDQTIGTIRKLMGIFVYRAEATA